MANPELTLHRSYPHGAAHRLRKDPMPLSSGRENGHELRVEHDCLCGAHQNDAAEHCHEAFGHHVSVCARRDRLIQRLLRLASCPT